MPTLLHICPRLPIWHPNSLETFLLWGGVSGVSFACFINASILKPWWQGCMLHTLEGCMRAHHGVRVQSPQCHVWRAAVCVGSGSLLLEQTLNKLLLKRTPQTKLHDEQGTSILEKNQKANQTNNMMHSRKMTALSFTLLCKLTWKI